jgi:hypothetical protein
MLAPQYSSNVVSNLQSDTSYMQQFSRIAFEAFPARLTPLAVTTNESALAQEARREYLEDMH